MLKEALEMHNHLNPAIWDKDWNLLPEVEDRIYKIVNKFQSECMLPLDIVDVHLVGSNASFNYNSQSDLDVHIVVNFDLLNVDKEILTAAYNLQKAQFNRDYDISIHGVNIEMYIEDINSMTASNGIYSLYNKKWIKKPVKKSYPTLDKRFYDTLNRLADKMRQVVSSDDEVEITKNINMLYMMRKNGLATDGEFSIGNLLFKEIRNLRLLDELKQRLKQVQSEKLTLENLDEAINPNSWFLLEYNGKYYLINRASKNYAIRYILMHKKDLQINLSDNDIAKRLIELTQYDYLHIIDDNSFNVIYVDHRNKKSVSEPYTMSPNQKSILRKNAASRFNLKVPFIEHHIYGINRNNDDEICAITCPSNYNLDLQAIHSALETMGLKDNKIDFTLYIAPNKFFKSGKLQLHFDS